MLLSENEIGIWTYFLGYDSKINIFFEEAV